MKCKLLFWSLMMHVVLSISCFGQDTVSIQSLLNEMINYESLARWSQPDYTMKQASSCDRRSVSPDKPGWFANADASQYIRVEEKSGHKEESQFKAGTER